MRLTPPGSTLEPLNQGRTERGGGGGGRGGGGAFAPARKTNFFFFLTERLILLGYFFLVAILVRTLYTGDPREGVRSLSPQTKNPRYGPVTSALAR